MDIFITIFTNEAFFAALIAWFFAQGIKVTVSIIKNKRFDLERVMGSGGMPSSHTASVMAATFAVGKHYGFDQPVFGLGLVFALIVMYDASGVRMAAGKQAKVINMVIRELGKHRFNLTEDLKELIGHTYLEVLIGMILGITIGLMV